MHSDPHLSPPPGKRSPAYAMRALGQKNLPEILEVDGATWRHLRTHKHDFWAVTGFYENDAGERAVLKLGRTEPFAGIELSWIGKLLCRREVRFYEKLNDLPNIPAIIGRVGETGFLHEFVDGAPLSKDCSVPDGFFARLHDLMRELHRRDIAYVDANKPQNILLGDDGLPHLIDFQISWDLHRSSGRLNRWLLRRLQRADIYHVLKHKKRLRPDEMTEVEWETVRQRSTFIRIHRIVTMPYKRLRRTTFKRLRASGRLLPEGSK